ncbi:MAG TPA: AIR carboxylase family protein, partial [Sphingomonadales bacterium]|nr:AIR carboxylase family protein [Sphingomonadales bacterium]
AEKRGLEVIIAAAGLAAHLPGVVAAQTLLPVLGVPMQGKALGGLDALLSIAQMPGGVPVGALAIGSHGAKNAALLAIRILANSRPPLREKLRAYHEKMAAQVQSESLE